MRQCSFVLVCPVTNPPTGIGVACGMLLDALRTLDLRFHHINTAPVTLKSAGHFSLVRVADVFRVIASFLVRVPKCNVVYLTISTSRTGVMWNLPLISIAKMLRKRVVLHLHGGGFRGFFTRLTPVERKLVAAVMKRVDRFIVLGDSLRDQFPFLDANDPKILVVPNTCALPSALGDLHVAPRGLCGAKPVQLLYMSNLIQSKGYADVLEACRILRQQGTEYHLHLCGGFVRTKTGVDDSAPQNEAQLAKMLKSLQLDECVTFHGVVRGRLKEQMFENADLFLLPTYYPWEGQPISIIEALAMGVPVISTRHRGIVDQVKDGYNGCFVDARSPQQIAAAVQKFTSTPASYRTLSENALQTFHDRFSHRVHIEKMMRALSDFPC